MPIKVIAFDADDTLWVNEPYFRDTENKFCSLLEDYLPQHTILQELFKTEIQQQDDFVTDCSIDTDLEILIPDNYVESITERLSLYSRLDNCETEEDLTAFHKEMTDRFGPIPPVVEDLFTTVRCRKIAVELGFEKMFLKNETLKCFFVSNPDSPYFQSETFNGILLFLQTGTNKGKLKQVGKNGILVVEDIKTMSELYGFITKMQKHIT